MEKEVRLFVDGGIEPADQFGFRVTNVERCLEAKDLEDISETRSYPCMLVAMS